MPFSKNVAFRNHITSYDIRELEKVQKLYNNKVPNIKDNWEITVPGIRINRIRRRRNVQWW